jgi:hypothetical protein
MSDVPTVLGDAVLPNGELVVLAGNQKLIKPSGASNYYDGFDQLQIAILSDATPYSLNQTTGNLSFLAGDSPDNSVEIPTSTGTEGAGTIAALPNGNIAVLTWGDPNLDYELQIVNSSGAVVTQPFVVSTQYTTPGSNDYYGSDAAAAIGVWSGGIVVGYATDNGTALYYQRYSLAGVVDGGPVAVDSAGTGTNTLWSEQMAVDSQGDVIFGFEGSNPDLGVFDPGTYEMYSNTDSLVATGTVADMTQEPSFAALPGGGFVTVNYTFINGTTALGGLMMNIQTVSTSGSITTVDSVVALKPQAGSYSPFVNWLSVLPDGTDRVSPEHSRAATDAETGRIPQKKVRLDPMASQGGY